MQATHARQTKIDPQTGAAFEFGEFTREWRMGIGSPRLVLDDGHPVVSLEVVLQNFSDRTRAYFDHGIHPFEFYIVDPKGTAWNLDKPTAYRLPRRSVVWNVSGGNQAEFTLKLPVYTRELVPGDYLIYGKIRIPEIGAEPASELLSGNVTFHFTTEQAGEANRRITEIFNSNPIWKSSLTKFIEPISHSAGQVNVKPGSFTTKTTAEPSSSLQSSAESAVSYQPPGSDPPPKPHSSGGILKLVGFLFVLGILALIVLFRGKRRF